MDVDKLSVVPEVFYDLISRVPAGMIVLVTGYILWPNCHLPSVLRDIGSSNIATVVVPVVGFVLSYVIGLALSAMSGDTLFFILDKLYRKKIAKGFRVLSERTEESSFLHAAKSGLRSGLCQRFRRRHKCGLCWGLWRRFWRGFGVRRRAQVRLNNLLKQEDARVGLEMSKHQAETSLFANLTAGFLLLHVVFLCSDSISCFNASLSPSAYRIVSILGAMSALVAFLRHRSGWRHLFGFGESYLRRNSSRGSSSSKHWGP
jgi:hypothetical protein